MLTLAVLIATLIADLAVGLAAFKMANSNTKAQAASSATDASILSLLAKHADQLANHEVRIVILEKAA